MPFPPVISFVLIEILDPERSGPVDKEFSIDRLFVDSQIVEPPYTGRQFDIESAR